MEVVTEKPVKKSVPEGYRQTVLGVIPEDWELTLLRDDVDLISGRHVMSKYCNTDGYGMPYITGPADFPNGEIEQNKFTNKPSSICKKYDILVTVKGSGAGSIVLANDRYCISRQLMAVRVNEFNYQYLFYQLKYNNGKLEQAATGLIPGLSRSDLLDLKIPTPTLEEQQAIAEALSDVDALIAEVDALIKKKQQIKKGAMQQLLTGKKRLPGFDGKWEEKKLGELVIRNELGGNYSNSKNRTSFPLIKMGNLNRGIINLDDLHYASNPSEVSERDRLDYGDLLFNTRNTPKLVGKVAVWRNELPKAYYNSNLMKLEFDENYIASNFFMNYTMNTESFIEKLKSIATGTTSVAAIYTRDLFTLNISVPPKEEQKAISQILNDMDKEIQALQSKRDKYQQIKQGMMQELLTGKTRLV